ncbi:MAG: hypothetical protein V4603_11005, partial [Pseudomonadota bacterium]
VIPEGQVPGPPAVLSLEDAEKLRAKRAKKADGFRSGPGRSTAAQRGKKAPVYKTKSENSYEKKKPEKRHESKPKDESAKTPGASIWPAAGPWDESQE